MKSKAENGAAEDGGDPMPPSVSQLSGSLSTGTYRYDDWDFDGSKNIASLWFSRVPQGFQLFFRFSSVSLPR